MNQPHITLATSSSILSSRGSLRAILLATITLSTLPLAGCGNDDAAVRVGPHTITAAAVTHWISVLVGRGTATSEGPPAPIPPNFTACIADQRAHPRPRPLGQSGTSKTQLKADCELEYRRFKLKALYLLISYQWVIGEAKELGVKLDKATLQHELAIFKQALNLNADSFRRYLKFTRATLSDLMISFEMNQLTRRIEEKIAGGAKAKSVMQQHIALVKFGREYERKWLAKTKCRAHYVVPLCQEYKKPKKPPEFRPPGVPLVAT